jgi:hypothetical protein
MRSHPARSAAAPLEPAAIHAEKTHAEAARERRALPWFNVFACATSRLRVRHEQTWRHSVFAVQPSFSTLVGTYTLGVTLSPTNGFDSRMDSIHAWIRFHEFDSEVTP